MRDESDGEIGRQGGGETAPLFFSPRLPVSPSPRLLLIPHSGWQVSAGYLSELLLPAAFALAVILSALVLADARRRRLPPGASLLWSLLALALPPVAIPLYLVSRLLSTPKRDDEQAHAQTTNTPADAQTTERTTDEETTADGVPVKTEVSDAELPQESDAEAPQESDALTTAPRKRRLRGLVVPLVYASTLLAAVAVYFYFDYRSADSHFARARSAELFGRRAEAVREYRAALALEDDAHTRKLLGVELLEARRWEESLDELRTAERMGEPDASLPFRIARALAALGRTEEAAAEYRRFLRTDLCARTPPDLRCDPSDFQLPAIK